MSQPTPAQDLESLRTALSEAPVKAKEPAPQKAEEDTFGALKALAEIGGLLLALAFVAGWSYMASYYTAFGLNPLELDFSVPATAAFALHVLRTSGWQMGLFAVPFLLYPFSRWLGAMFRIACAVCVGGLLFWVAWVGSERGRVLAKEDMLETSPRLPDVGFTAKTKASEPSCLSDGTVDCKLLLHSKGSYYFFEPIRVTGDLAAASLSNLNVYMVPESEVTNVHVSPGCGSTKVSDFSEGSCK